MYTWNIILETKGKYKDKPSGRSRIQLFLTTRKKNLQKLAKCDICGKSVTFGIQVSHSHRRSNRAWKPNIKRVKAMVAGSPKRIYACTRCLRSGKVTRAV